MTPNFIDNTIDQSESNMKTEQQNNKDNKQTSQNQNFGCEDQYVRRTMELVNG